MADDFTQLMNQAEAGDATAAGRLIPLVYEELRKLAAAKMSREQAGQTLQATALVHEAWLRLGGDDQPEWSNRAHFFGAAGQAMRRILVERARRRQALRRGGDLQRVDPDDFELAAPELDDDELLAVNDALERFAEVEPEKARLVQLRYFVGLRIDETALTMGISVATAKRWWVYARAWLKVEMARSS